MIEREKKEQFHTKFPKKFLHSIQFFQNNNELLEYNECGTDDDDSLIK